MNSWNKHLFDNHDLNQEGVSSHDSMHTIPTFEMSVLLSNLISVLHRI